MTRFVFRALPCLFLLIATTAWTQPRLVYLDPPNDEVWVVNFDVTNIDLTDYMWCSLLSYSGVSTSTIISGSMDDLAPGDTLKLSGVSITDAAADLSIYLPGTVDFTSPNQMVDFAQYGDSGLGREPVADSKGIWTAGDFIDGEPPFRFTGGADDHGVTFWEAASPPLAIGDPVLDELTASPNPTTDAVRIGSPVPVERVEVYDATGRLVDARMVSSATPDVELGNNPPGRYWLRVVAVSGASGVLPVDVAR